jgi:hypothetical protein
VTAGKSCKRSVHNAREVAGAEAYRQRKSNETTTGSMAPSWPTASTSDEPPGRSAPPSPARYPRGCRRNVPSATAGAPSLSTLNHASRTRVRNQRRATTSVSGLRDGHPHRTPARLCPCLDRRPATAAVGRRPQSGGWGIRQNIRWRGSRLGWSPRTPFVDQGTTSVSPAQPSSRRRDTYSPR